MIATLMLLHGIAHLPGFLAPFGLDPRLPYKTMIFSGAFDAGDAGIRAIGVLWLLTAAAFVTAAIGAYKRTQHWMPLALGLSLWSLLLCASELPAAQIGMVVDAGLIVVLGASLLMRRNLALSSLIAMAPLLAVGCVSQGKYDDLKTQYDNARADIGQHQVQIGTLEQSLQDERDKVKALQTQIDQLQTQLSAQQEQLNESGAENTRLRQEQLRLNGDLAVLVKDRSKLKESTGQLQAALAELSARKMEAERRIAEFKTLLARFKNLIDAGTLRVTIADGRMVLQLPSDVLFDSGSAKLSKVGKEAIGQVALVLKDMHERRFQIEGHTDNVPIHNAQYASNWELASARALGVVRAMTEAGMEGMPLSAASYGEYHPTASNESEAGRKMNRRIEIVLLPDLSMLPGYEELNKIVSGT